jgi:hypothetical protein
VDVRDGKDPRTVLQRQAKGEMTFRQLAEEYLAEHQIKYARQGQKSRWTMEVERLLKRNVLPEIGDAAADGVT